MKNLDSTADHACWTIENGNVLDMLHLLDENTFDGLTPLDLTPSDLGSALLAVPPEAWEDWDEDRDAAPGCPVPARQDIQGGQTVRCSPRWNVTPFLTDRDYLVSPGGTFAYINALLPQGQPLNLFSPPGFVVWHEPVAIPMLIDMGKDSRTNGQSSPDSAYGTPPTWDWTSKASSQATSSANRRNVTEGPRAAACSMNSRT